MEKMLTLTRREWERFTTSEAWSEVGATCYAEFFAVLTQTRGKTSYPITRALTRAKYPASPKRYMQGNLLLLQEGWRPGGAYELYAFHSEGLPVGEKGYHHRLTADSMMLVQSGTLPTDGDR